MSLITNPENRRFIESLRRSWDEEYEKLDRSAEKEEEHLSRDNLLIDKLSLSVVVTPCKRKLLLL